MRDLASIYGISRRQLEDLHGVYNVIKHNKPTLFVKVPEAVITDDLRSLPNEWLCIMGNEVQMSERAYSVCKEYEEEWYFAEHNNDEIHTLGIDIETYSSNDLSKGGVYKYVEAEDFAILLFAYSVNDSPVRVIDLACGEQIPDRIITALQDDKVLKTAYNANFERVCIGRYLGVYLRPEEWDCTMVKAVRLGLPFSLAQCAEVLGLENKKMAEGASLIRYFSCPCKPTKVNGGRTRNLPEHDMLKWETFKRYNKRDVEVEQEIRRKLDGRNPLTETERKAWFLDQTINDRGVMIDVNLAHNASIIDDQYKQGLVEELKNLTGLSNPNSVMQLKQWLYNETGLRLSSLDKESVAQLLSSISSEKAKRVLYIRQELGKTSTKKYKSMLECVCADNRVRGLLQFYGASRTGRFAGRLVQLQNLPQNHIPDIDNARSLVKDGDIDGLMLEYGNAPKVLSELIRTALIAEDGKTFIVCDFSAIEARVIAWIAGEDWVLDVFRNNGDVYCATASQMFGVPVEKHGANAELRAKGKIAVLALGFGGGVNALEKMGGAKMGLSQEEMNDIVTKWRDANKRIVRLWRHVELAAKYVLTQGTESTIERGLRFFWDSVGLCIELPSKRRLYYPKMRINDNGRFVYEGLNQTTKRWESIETYGGKMTENIVQAIARDCLIDTMLRLESKGFKIVFHIHDETVIEATLDQSLNDIKNVFCEPISWAPGLPLKGEGYVTPYYLKD